MTGRCETPKKECDTQKHHYETTNSEQLSLLLSFVPCSEKIHSAVTEMASLFPKVSSVDFLVYLLLHPLCLLIFFLSFLHSGQHWMQSTAPSASWLPVPRGCR